MCGIFFTVLCTVFVCYVVLNLTIALILFFNRGVLVHAPVGPVMPGNGASASSAKDSVNGAVVMAIVVIMLVQAVVSFIMLVWFVVRRFTVERASRSRVASERAPLVAASLK